MSNQGKKKIQTMSSYIVGFVLSIILTIIPYLIVSRHIINETNLIILSVVLFAVLQLIVQLTFFLHLSAKPEQRWNLFTFIFTFIVLSILVSGTLWIMYSMNYNMMVNI